MQKHARNSVYILIFLLVMYLVMLKAVPVVFGALSIALIFSLVVDVIAEYLCKYLSMKRRWGVIFATLLWFGVISYLVYSVVPFSLRQGKLLLDNVQSFDLRSIFPLSGPLASFFDDLVSTMYSTFYSFLKDVIGYVATKLPDIVTTSILVVVASAYLTHMRNKIRSLLPRFFPATERKHVDEFFVDVYLSIRRFVAGQLLTALVVGITTYFGFLILGISYAGFFGMLAGVTDFIPFLGVIITAVPAFMTGALDGGVVGLIKVAAVLVLSNQLEMWVFAPRIASTQVKINWFVILVTMLTFAYLFGVVGVLVAVPFLIFSKLLWRSFLSKLINAA